MTAQIDEVTVRQFLEIINTHAAQVINGAGPPGVLQLCRINPNDEKVVPSRFQIGDVDRMLTTALGDASAGHNVYIEPRTVRADLRGTKRGELEDTAWVFGLVVDSGRHPGPRLGPRLGRRRVQRRPRLLRTSFRPSASSRASSPALSRISNTHCSLPALLCSRAQEVWLSRSAR
jgi:hypothetical protein